MINLKERIYSIPLSEAIEESRECVLCTLESKLEEQAIEYFLGESLMEPSIREMTNRKGFCRRHLSKLYNNGNRLGLALVLDTHLSEIRNVLSKKFVMPKSGLFSKRANIKNTENMIEALNSVDSGCAVCEKVDAQMKNAAKNLIFLWKTEREFRYKLEQANGFCLPHMKVLLEEAKRELSGKDFEKFIKFLYKKQEESLRSLNDDLNWFTKKYDYKNQDAPWGTAKDSLPRAIQRLKKIQ